jgi:hypothetical protein
MYRLQFYLLFKGKVVKKVVPYITINVNLVTLKQANKFHNFLVFSDSEGPPFNKLLMIETTEL